MDSRPTPALPLREWTENINHHNARLYPMEYPGRRDMQPLGANPPAASWECAK
jgi:hypothetical protein